MTIPIASRLEEAKARVFMLREARSQSLPHGTKVDPESTSESDPRWVPPSNIEGAKADVAILVQQNPYGLVPYELGNDAAKMIVSKYRVPLHKSTWSTVVYLHELAKALGLNEAVKGKPQHGRTKKQTAKATGKMAASKNVAGQRDVKGKARGSREQAGGGRKFRKGGSSSEYGFEKSVKKEPVIERQAKRVKRRRWGTS